MSDLQVRAALGLLRKTLPDLAMTQIDAAINGNSHNHLHLHLDAAMQVSKQMMAEPKRTITIEPQAQDAPSGSLLDAPLPTE